MKMSKSNIGLIKDLILAEISHDILESPKKEDGVQLPFENKKGGLAPWAPFSTALIIIVIHTHKIPSFSNIFYFFSS